MPTKHKSLESLTKRLEQAIRVNLPKATGADEHAQIELWMEREDRFKGMYASLVKFRRRLFEQHGLAVQGTGIVFNPPDVLRAELLANGDPKALEHAVEAATARECTKLANLLTGPVFSSFQQAGLVGTVESFSSSVRRLALSRPDGAHFVCDMAAASTVTDQKSLWAVSRRMVRLFPAWLSSELVVHMGRCVRLSDDQQQLLTPPVGNAAVLALGPFVFATSPAIVPAVPRPAIFLPPLPRLNTIGIYGAAAGVVAPLTLGLATNSTWLTAFGGLGIVAAVFVLLAGRTNCARTP